jgi:hypothetical protein
MRIFTASISLGSLALIGTLPATGQSTLPLRSPPSPFQLAAGSDSTTNRDTFIQKVRDEMLEWQRKLHELSEKAEAKGKDAYNAAGNDLDKAWNKAELRHVNYRPWATKAGRAPKSIMRRHPTNWRRPGTRFIPGEQMTGRRRRV